MTRHIPRIVSALVGLSLVLIGAWLCVSGHADAGSLVLVGGLGTLGLPSATPRPRAAKLAPVASAPATEQESGSEGEQGRETTVPPEPPSGAGPAILIFACAVSAAHLSGCSSGPQLPVITTPISITCQWNAPDSGAIEDCDCLVDRASAPSTATTGNDARGASVSVPVSVSAD